MSKRCSHGNLPLVRLQGSLLIARYYHRDLQKPPIDNPSQDKRPFRGIAHLLAGVWGDPRQPDISSMLQCYPFSRQFHSAGELLHSP